jgi:hypothetical protein
MRTADLPAAGALFLGLVLSVHSVALAGSEPASPSPSRVEVTLANELRQDADAIKKEFEAAGLSNVHVQFMRQGQPPPNIGVGRDVPVERAQTAIRLAKKYNRGVQILLPEHLFPASFITIASSNFDDTVDYPIDEAALRQLEDPALTSEQFHSLYRRLTPPGKAPVKKGRSF